MEIKLSVKAPGRADVNFEFSCNAEEATILINDPVYQEIGMVLIDQLKRESEQCRNHDRKVNQHNDHCFEYMRKVYENDMRDQANLEISLRRLHDQLNRMLDKSR